jgi:hypothetical protein
VAIVSDRRGELIDTTQTVDGPSVNIFNADAFPNARALVVHLLIFSAAGAFDLEQSIDGGATWLPVGSQLSGIAEEHRIVTRPVGLYRTNASGSLNGAVTARYQVK